MTPPGVVWAGPKVRRANTLVQVIFDLIPYSYNCIIFIHIIYQNIKIGTTLKDYARNICSDIDLAIAKACAFESPGMPGGARV